MLGVLLVFALAFGATPASGLIERLAGGAAVSVQSTVKKVARARDLAFLPVEYHGGPVMSANTNYVIWWDPQGVAKYAPKFTAGVQDWFKNIQRDSGKDTNTDDVLTQYGANYVSKFGGALKDKDHLPGNGCSYSAICLTDAQLRVEIQYTVESHGLPQDLTHEYFLFTGPGIESCLEATGGFCSANSASPRYCAYHGAIETEHGTIIYAVDPYVYEKNCDEPGHRPNGPSDSALLAGLAHEHSESLTDPELNAWINPLGEEVGDICRTFEPATEFGAYLGTAVDGSPYNYVIQRTDYLYQQEWSNNADSCVQRN